MNLPTFQYNPIDLGEPTFRLAILEAGTEEEITVQIIEANFKGDDLIEYSAVSYFWGSKKKPKAIRVGDSMLPVTCNLWDMLHDLRDPSEKLFLWIDAICINQANPVERNHQVGQMGRIYHEADKVIFYLGPSTDWSRELICALDNLKDQCDDRFWELEDPRWIDAWERVKMDMSMDEERIEDHLRQDLKVVLSRPWFRRVWILQEVANAKSGVVHCGSERIPVRFFAVCPRLLGLEPDPYQQKVLDMMPLKHRNKSEWSSHRDLYDLLRWFAGAEATEEHDKIFALLGMCIDGNGNGEVVADYRKKTAEVIRETIVFMCFCDPEDVPASLCVSIEGFFANIKTLHITLLREFVMNSRLMSLQRLVNERSEYMEVTPEILQIALSRNSDQGAIQYLLQLPMFGRGTDTEARDEEGMTPLLSAARIGHLNITRMLLEREANIEAKDYAGRTALAVATLNGHYAVAKLLVECGANTDAEDCDGMTPLDWAFWEARGPFVPLFLDSKSKRMKGVSNQSNKS